MDRLLVTDSHRTHAEAGPHAPAVDHRLPSLDVHEAYVASWRLSAGAPRNGGLEFAP